MCIYMLFMYIGLNHVEVHLKYMIPHTHMEHRTTVLVCFEAPTVGSQGCLCWL